MRRRTPRESPGSKLCDRALRGLNPKVAVKTAAHGDHVDPVCGDQRLFKTAVRVHQGLLCPGNVHGLRGNGTQVVGISLRQCGVFLPARGTTRHDRDTKHSKGLGEVLRKPLAVQRSVGVFKERGEGSWGSFIGTTHRVRNDGCDVDLRTEDVTGVRQRPPLIRHFRRHSRIEICGVRGQGGNERFQFGGHRFPDVGTCDILHTVPVPAQTIAPRPLLRDDVFSRLRTAIIDGTFAPDEQLRDTDLATWLGVSRTPVREALLELARAGLVRTTPGRSTVVAPLDAQAVRHAQAVVAALHALAVRLAVPRLSADDIERMRQLNAEFTTAHATGDTDAALRADAAFHDVAVTASGNDIIRSVLAQHEPVLQRAERLRFASAEGAESGARHEELIERCAAGDAEGAAAVAEQTWQSLTLDSPDDEPTASTSPSETP